MKRRTFLATAGLVATAGCLGRAVSDGDGTTTREAASCPTVHDSLDATICAGEPNDRAVSFGQSADRLWAGEVLELTLVNEDAESVEVNPYDWGVYQETGDGWERVESGPPFEPGVVLEPGECLRWRLGVGDATPDTDDETVYGESVDLDPGEYAFATTATVAGDRVSLVAPFTVE